MKKFAELSLVWQLAIFLIIPALVIATAEYFYFPFAANGGDLQEWQTANSAADEKLKKLQGENDKLRPVEARLLQIKKDNADLETRLNDLRNVVPSEKDTDEFIRMVRSAGDETGVQVRRFTPLPPVNKEFYTELPFEVEVDGNWHSLTQFLSRIGALPRIANIGSMAIGPIASSVRGVRKHYDYSKTETVAASATITTFYRRPGDTDKKK